MIEELNNTGTRLIALRAKLKARDGKHEYRESNDALRAEIARLEARTIIPKADPPGTPSRSRRKRKSTKPAQ